MDLYSVNSKNFKRTFILIIIYGVAAVIAAYFVGRSGWLFISSFTLSRQITLPALLLMFIISVWFSGRLRKRVAAMNEIEDFELKVQEYEKIYRSKLQWNLLSVLILSFLFVLTMRNFVLYFAIFQVLVMLPMYPSAALFKRDLRNDEIILY